MGDAIDILALPTSSIQDLFNLIATHAHIQVHSAVRLAYAHFTADRLVGPAPPPISNGYSGPVDENAITAPPTRLIIREIRSATSSLPHQAPNSRRRFDRFIKQAIRDDFEALRGQEGPKEQPLLTVTLHTYDPAPHWVEEMSPCNTSREGQPSTPCTCTNTNLKACEVSARNPESVSYGLFTGCNRCRTVERVAVFFVTYQGPLGIVWSRLSRNQASGVVVRRGSWVTVF